MKSYLNPTNFLIPKDVNEGFWSVIACDQFTSEVEYWSKLKEFVGDNNSSLNIIYPEAFLRDKSISLEERITGINATMENYLKNNVFLSTNLGYILVERITSYGNRHLGLIGTIDLEDYSYNQKEKPPIRPTERTVEERLPIRVKILENAPIESSHTMVLYNSKEEDLCEYLYSKRDTYKKLYDFELNMNGGHIRGWFIPYSEEINQKFDEIYINGETSIMFAVGDGNHSMAAAKKHWESIKEGLTAKEKEKHPARQFLVEVINIQSKGIIFEPIHRFLKNPSKEDIEIIKGMDCSFSIYENGSTTKKIGKMGTIESIKAIDSFAFERKIDTDYIHGLENIKSLVDDSPFSIGIVFDSIDKNSLFSYVENNGVLPKKTFSMGEGIEKKYYLECIKIKI